MSLNCQGSCYHRAGFRLAKDLLSLAAEGMAVRRWTFALIVLGLFGAAAGCTATPIPIPGADDGGIGLLSDASRGVDAPASSRSDGGVGGGKDGAAQPGADAAPRSDALGPVRDGGLGDARGRDGGRRDGGGRDGAAVDGRTKDGSAADGAARDGRVADARKGG